jgi:basic membrane lipoprotein Med (substrate-binding protein (PBP1-ABC) superfamily)
LTKAEAERLEELRLRVLEQRFEAELALGRHEERISELQLAVANNPFRERFTAQLMLALYRSGRHADALELYEKTRSAMGDELGLQPSAELQQLSGQMVRQEPRLTRATHPAQAAGTTPKRRTARMAAGLTLAGLAAAALVAFTAEGSAPRPIGESGSRSPRLAVVLPRAPASSRRNDLMNRYLDSVRRATHGSGDAETIVADETDSETANLVAVASRLRSGRFDLVLWIGDGAAAQALAPEVRALSETTFVFIDASLKTLDLQDVPNASAVRFADEQASELVGYLSGLVRSRQRSGQRADVVSVVAGFPTRHTRLVIAGFERGVRRALPRAKVLIDYSEEVVDRTSCEQAANSQIDRGSDVVFATAGECGLGALAVAETRGVWGVGDDELERASGRFRSRMLAHTYKEDEPAVSTSLDAFADGTLPVGKDRVLGLDDNYAVGIWDINVAVPQVVRSKVVGLCSSIRSAHPHAT